MTRPSELVRAAATLAGRVRGGAERRGAPREIAAADKAMGIA